MTRPVAVDVVTGDLTYEGAVTAATVTATGTLTLRKTGQPDVPLDNFGGVACVSAPLAVVTVGAGLRVAEGGNAKMGVATLTAGAATVATTAVAATSRIFLTCQTPGGTPGFLRVSARTASTSFTITSSSGTDTSIVAWMIVDPA